jgi:hypothetical protein
MRWLRFVKTTYTRNKVVMPGLTIFDRVLALELSHIPERVPFTEVDGTFTLSLTVNSRNTKYVAEKALAYYLIDGVPQLVDGFSIKPLPDYINPTSLEIGGLFGSGYILLTL